MLSGGWGTIQEQFSLPFKDIALILGLGWLVTLVIFDAILSPGGNGNIFMNTTSRLVYAWSRNGTLFKRFSKVDKKTENSRASLWLSFGMSVFWTLPFSFLGSASQTYVQWHLFCLMRLRQFQLLHSE